MLRCIRGQVLRDIDPSGKGAGRPRALTFTMAAESTSRNIKHNIVSQNWGYGQGVQMTITTNISISALEAPVGV